MCLQLQEILGFLWKHYELFRGLASFILLLKPREYSSVSTIKMFKTGSKISFNWKFLLTFLSFRISVLATYIHSSFSTFSVLLIHKSLYFGKLSLELHDTPIFRWKCNTSGVLSLHSFQTCLKLEWPVLEMPIVWCRTTICSWNRSVEESLMLVKQFSFPFLCNLKYISLFFIQNSMQITLQ